MNLLIKFPTRARKDQFFTTLHKYLEMSTVKNRVGYLITMDHDDLVMNTEEVKKQLDSIHRLVYFYGNSKTKIQAVNNDINKIADWDIILLASDDMVPVVKGYDEIIIDNMEKHFPDTDGVLFFNDGSRGSELNTLSILGKKYYNRFNYIYNPEYISVWADNEFTKVANILGRQVYFPQTIIRHEHPDYGYNTRDYVHLNNHIYNNRDREVFLKRESVNFYL